MATQPRAAMTEREAALRDAVTMADHLRGLATEFTSTGRAQRRMATRIIQAIEAEIARGE